MKPIITRFIATLCCLFSLPLSAADRSSKLADQPPSFGPKSGEPWENLLGMKFVPVPGTNVLFSIWETRVQDFEAFVKATSHNAGEYWRAPGASGQGHVAGFSQTPLHPVVNVSWNDAEAFCRWLTEKERAAGNLSAGQELDGAKFTAKVGSYTANRLGIYDLGGNVWEWCSDWFNAERKDRVIRGASFVQGAPGVLLSSHHSRKPPGTRDSFNLGFRCVVAVDASSP